MVEMIGQGPVDCAGFISMLIGLLFARMAPAVTSLGEEMDDIEEDVLDGSANALREQIVSIRKKAIIFKRYMAPQRDLITHLLEAKIDWFADHNHQHMIEAHDNITRFVSRRGNLPTTRVFNGALKKQYWRHSRR